MEQQIMQIMDSIEPRLYWMLGKLIISGIIGMSIYSLMVNIVAYIMIRMNKDLNKGVEIRVNDKDGVIMDYGLNFIRIKLKGGNDLLIPISKWKQMAWEIRDNITSLYGYKIEEKEE